MSNELSCCLWRDLLEFIRKKKLLLCSLILILLGIMVTLTNMFIPDMMKFVLEKSPDMIQDTESIDLLMSKLFPSNLTGNMAVFSSNIGSMYILVIVFLSYKVLVDEIKTGKWILPVGAGYNKKNLLLSKLIVYGLGTSIPVGIVYIIVYFVSSFVFTRDYLLRDACVNSLILIFIVFSVSCFTISFSAIYKNGILAAITIIGIVMIFPDILSYFSIGKYFPTYLLTFVYDSKNSYGEIVFPVCIVIVLLWVSLVLAIRKAREINVSR